MMIDDDDDNDGEFDVVTFGQQKVKRRTNRRKIENCKK